MYKLKNWILILSMLVLSSSASAQDRLGFPNTVTITPPRCVQAFKGDDQQHVIYELVVTNYSQNPILITALHVEGAKLSQSHTIHHSCNRSQADLIINELQNIQDTRAHFINPKQLLNKTIAKKNTCHIIYERTFVGQELASIYSSILGPTNLPQTPLLQPGDSGILFLFLEFSSLEHVPNSLVNLLDIEIQGTTSTFTTVGSNAIAVDKCSPIVLKHPPLRGDLWYAAEGPSNFNHHRRQIFVVTGELLQNARLAIDFIQYGPQGLFEGNPLDNRSYYCYGQEMYAVAAGVITIVKEGVSDNTPGQVPPLPLSDLAGNYIVLEIDADNQAFYAHCIPGSIRVKEGDRVHAGQVLARVGNSGSSDLPHLHFQMGTVSRPIIGSTETIFKIASSQGMPWVLDRFIKINYIPIFDPTEPGGIPINVQPLDKFKVKKQMLMDRNLVDFR